MYRVWFVAGLLSWSRSVVMEQVYRHGEQVCCHGAGLLSWSRYVVMEQVCRHGAGMLSWRTGLLSWSRSVGWWHRRFACNNENNENYFNIGIFFGFSYQKSQNSSKLGKVGPVDNRHSTEMLHHFVWQKYVTWDTWHSTHGRSHATGDMWHLTWGILWGVNFLSKCQLPSSCVLWFMIFWRFQRKGWLTEESN